MPVSTVGLITFFSILAAVQHYRNLPETTEKATRQAEKQMRYDEKNRQLDAELEAERIARNYPTTSQAEINESAGYVSQEISATPTVEATVIPTASPLPSFMNPERPVIQGYSIIVLETPTTSMAPLLKECVKRAMLLNYNKFTCQKEHTVIFYYENFSGQILLSRQPTEQELTPTWINVKEITQ